MGQSEKPIKVDDGGVEAESKKCVVAGISDRCPLKPIFIKPVEDKEQCDDVEEFPTTPTAEEARIPIGIMVCPPAPRKPKAISTCQFYGFRDFFIPPDLDSVFIRSVERA